MLESGSPYFDLSNVYTPMMIHSAREDVVST